jgi:hypothetical protein
MHTTSSILIVALLCCGSLAGVARRNVINEDEKSVTKFENASASKPKSEVLVQEAAFQGEEEDTRLDMPVRDARAENISPIIQGQFKNCKFCFLCALLKINFFS